MAEQTIYFRLPLPGWPRAEVESTYGYHGARVILGGAPILHVESREALERGARAPLFGGEHTLHVRLLLEDRGPELEVRVGDEPAVREDRIYAPPSRTAWIHAWVALLASAFGFAASYLYLLVAEKTGDPWPLKMAQHMAGWHLLLTVALFPLAVWGQRFGIRLVQVTSALFFAIHVGIALANTGGGGYDDPWIAVLNALSGLGFFAATFIGNKAHREMDPVRALPEIVRPACAERR